MAQCILSFFQTPEFCHYQLRWTAKKNILVLKTFLNISISIANKHQCKVGQRQQIDLINQSRLKEWTKEGN